LDLFSLCMAVIDTIFFVEFDIFGGMTPFCIKYILKIESRIRAFVRLLYIHLDTNNFRSQKPFEKLERNNIISRVSTTLIYRLK
jgi:hypothetical protein